jgi:hypothetical protein
MKRIAALAALVITLLAVPAATAMAGPSGSGSGYGQPPRLVQVACLSPYQLRKGHVTVKVYAQFQAYAKAYRLAHRHGKPVPIRLICPRISAKPLPKGCRPQILRFDMAAGSSTLTEVSGPILAPPMEFGYDGNTYTIMSVNPGADSFTVFLNGWRFVNHGAAITDATGYLTCTN